jgi:uncharacterized membrane protein YqjE
LHLLDALSVEVFLFMEAVQRHNPDSSAVREANGRPRLQPDESVGTLLKQISTDSTHLIQQEIALAKLELKESVAAAGKSAAQLGIAMGVAIPGMLSLVAFLVIGLGDLMNDNYWASALIVAVACLAIAAVLARRAISNLKGRLGIPETTGTLRDDAAWAKREVQSFKRELTA